MPVEVAVVVRGVSAGLSVTCFCVAAAASDDISLWLARVRSGSLVEGPSALVMAVLPTSLVLLVVSEVSSADTVDFASLGFGNFLP